MNNNLCLHCNKSIENKSWLHLTGILSVNENGDSIKGDKHICGYSCYKRLSESKSLPIKYPDRLWDHVVNIEDYKGLIRPEPKQLKKSFEYLTVKEIYELNEVNKEKYYKEKDEQIHLNPELTLIHDELEEEDKRTTYLEESSSGDEFTDDY